MKHLYFTLVISACLMSATDGTAALSLSTARELYPTATRVSPWKTSTVVHCVYVADRCIAHMVDTRLCASPPRGYAGTTPLLAGASSPTSPVSIVVLPNRETPSYTAHVCAHAMWTVSCTSTPVALARRRDVDAVSGATYTSRSLTLTLRRAAHHLVDSFSPAPVSHTIPSSTQSAPVDSTHLLSLLCVGGTYILAIVLSLFHLFRLHWVKVVFRLWVVTALGFLFTAYFSIEHLMRGVTGHVPPLSHITWYLVVCVALLSPLVAGRFYCRWLCPFGVATDLLHSLCPVSYVPGTRVMRYARWVKFLLLIIVVIAAVVYPGFSPANAEPFNPTFSPSYSWIYRGVALGILVVSCVIRRFWCTIFCVDGALFEVITRTRENARARRPSTRT